MPPTALLAGLCVASAAAWAASFAAVVRTIRAVPMLRDDDSPPPARWPRVSLVVPARDEARDLERAVKTRLADDYPDLQVILVDDRSTDGTGAIADRLAAGDPRVRVVHVTELPAGWLGKLHALDRGVAVADGEWILFSDADIEFAPGTLRRTVSYCERHGRDHLTVLPYFRENGLLVDAAIHAFARALVVLGRLWAVPDMGSRAAVGGGIFNLVRRSALERTAGFEYLRLEIADDVALAQMLKRAGARPAVVNAVGFVTLDFYKSLPEMAWGLEKNSFAVIARFRVWVLTLVTLVSVVLTFGFAAGFAHPSPWARALAAATLAASLAEQHLLSRWAGRPSLPGFLYPFGLLAVLAITWRSAWRCLRRGGVAWRETVYPIRALREGSRLELL
jgi:cellulose synthase/poly-beta-1,6-N-acetylglucosamine synthase-like glycosyltransferase